MQQEGQEGRRVIGIQAPDWVLGELEIYFSTLCALCYESRRRSVLADVTVCFEMKRKQVKRWRKTAVCNNCLNLLRICERDYKTGVTVHIIEEEVIVRGK